MVDKLAYLWYSKPVDKFFLYPKRRDNMAKVMRELIVCDICGEEANGNWYRTEYCNNEVSGEYSAPISMCEEHASRFPVYANEFEVERYDSISENEVVRLIELMKSDDEE